MPERPSARSDVDLDRDDHAASLGLVRAAQGRDEEAEELFAGGLRPLQAPTSARSSSRSLKPLAQFLRERGREDEALSRADERREELFPAAAKSSARIA